MGGTWHRYHPSSCVFHIFIVSILLVSHLCASGELWVTTAHSSGGHQIKARDVVDGEEGTGGEGRELQARKNSEKHENQDPPLNPDEGAVVSQADVPLPSVPVPVILLPQEAEDIDKPLDKLHESVGDAVHRRGEEVDAAADLGEVIHMEQNNFEKKLSTDQRKAALSDTLNDLDSADLRRSSRDSQGRPRSIPWTARYWGAFTASFLLIVSSEIGDKTFFIAVVLAMKYSGSIIFAGACSALAVMTLLSGLAGYALPNLLPQSFTHYASICLFFFFGLRLLWEAWFMEEVSAVDEIASVEAELKKDDDVAGSIEAPSVRSSVAPEELHPSNSARSKHAGTPSGHTSLTIDPEAQPSAKGSITSSRGSASRQWRWTSVFVQAFTLTFVAEWGDRSQIATIALASSQEPRGVIGGAIIAHCVCTGLAVAGGSVFAGRISEKAVSFFGGVLFLIFGFAAFIAGPEFIQN
eukprot:GHVN01030065.1.p1 GENE.GHVN01030065.1~~GHVN01030065.1.p1  ORF type:complete len:467 (+),score=45.15 GHVN01030065.1:78-1478(+)